MSLPFLQTETEETTVAQLEGDDFFNELRSNEYSRLDTHGHVYLDFTGGNLYAESQLKKHFELLQNHVFGNPHSTNPTSVFSTQLVEETRAKVIRFFNGDDYHCVFTPNASGALKIVGESYPFNDNGALLLLSDNHNSVNGIREYCKEKGGTFHYCPIQYENLRINDEAMEGFLNADADKKNKLFAFPAQSNVSGVKHDLNWIKRAQEKGWDVLLDAAAFVPTSKLDLKEVQPDFVSVSFYKIFGYPTGIGCLLIRKSKFDKLKKPWFAGGTVTLVSVNSQQHFLAHTHERFEDGTLNYLDIPAIKIGLDYIESIGMERITNRIKALMEWLSTELNAMAHDNGQKLVKIFGPNGSDKRGGTFVMNFLDPQGQPYPIGEIEKMANAQLISLRSGCFCNPGIDEVNNCITNEELSKYFMSRDKGDYYEMISFLGKMRGATRISVGIATNQHDLEKFTSLILSLRNRTVTASE